MALGHSAKVATENLVVFLDAASIKNSKSTNSENLLTNSAFQGGLDCDQETGGSNPTNTIIELPNPGESKYVLEQTGTTNTTEYEVGPTGLSASTTYCMSGWYAESEDYSGNSRMFHSRAHSSSGAHNALGTGIGTLITSKDVDSLNWQFRYANLTTPSDFNGDYDWYVGYDNSAYSGHRYYTNLKIEKGSFPSLYNIASKTNKSSFSYTGYSSSNKGVLTFNGTNNYIDISSDNSGTVSCVDIWMYNFNSISGDGAIGGPSTYQTLCGWNLTQSPGISLGGWTGGMTNETIHIWSSGSAGTYIRDTISAGWHHVVFNWNGSSYDIWVDGTKRTTYAHTTSGHAAQLTDVSSYRFGGNVSAGYYFNGQLGPIKVYDSVALTDTEILNNFNAYRGRFGI